MPAPDPPDDAHVRFITLFLQSEREVLRYVLALVPDLREAREIVQSSAIELWRKFSDYDPARPFTPWACRFALHETQTQPNSAVPGEKEENNRHEGIGRSDSRVLFVLV